jgi:iron complex transport system permease protein
MGQIMLWTMGGLQSAGWEQVTAVLPGIAAGIAILYIFSRDLNIMLLGEESAQHLGVNTDRLKKVILLVGALITGLSVSVSGVIGFVGIVIPHIVRIILGPDNRIMIPFTAAAGAIFLMGADALARILIPPSEIPVGILTAVVGGPFFIYLLFKSRRKLV